VCCTISPEVSDSIGVKSPRYWSTPCSYRASKGIASALGGGGGAAGGPLGGADPEPLDPEHADSTTVDTRKTIPALVIPTIVDILLFFLLEEGDVSKLPTVTCSTVRQWAAHSLKWGLKGEGEAIVRRYPEQFRA
jgi:hypothetical protein